MGSLGDTAATRAVIGFAHRGAPGPGVRENTLTAFRAAIDGGARALESDVWLTSDAVPVLVHDGYLGRWPLRQDLTRVRTDRLPEWLPTLAQLYEECGTGSELSLDVKDPGGAAAIFSVAQAAGAAHRLWLCGSTDQLRSWRPLSDAPHLVASTTLRRGPAEPVASDVAAAGGEVVNLRWPEWTRGHLAAVHQQGLKAFAWDVQRRDVLDRLLGWGIDGVYSDSVHLLVDALG